MYHISPNNYPDQITILVIKQAKFEETQGPKISMFEGGKNKKKIILTIQCWGQLGLQRNQMAL